MQSHHSHSGEFCHHAVDTLEDVILEAIRQKFETFCLTEHMPRDTVEALYPEEKHLTPEDLHIMFHNYYRKAVSLRTKYADQIRILIGAETEYISPDSIRSIQALQEKYDFDYCVGSIHHVEGIPIDYNVELWEKAKDACGGTEELLFAKYFDEQHELLVNIKPLIVGHFDVIRLFAPDKMVKLSQWPTVWSKVVRNIDAVVEYGGLFELNSAAFRKGFPEAYPTSEIAKAILEKGGKFVLSDDSHGIAQVGLNYHRLFNYIRALGLLQYYHVEVDEGVISIKGNTVP